MSSISLRPEAERDLEEIFDYVATRDPDAAYRLINEITGAYQALADHPYLGRERPDISPGLRALPVGTYVILHRSTDDRVVVTRILHTSRNLSVLLNGY